MAPGVITCFNTLKIGFFMFQLGIKGIFISIVAGMINFTSQSTDNRNTISARTALLALVGFTAGGVLALCIICGKSCAQDYTKSFMMKFGVVTALFIDTPLMILTVYILSFTHEKDMVGMLSLMFDIAAWGFKTWHAVKWVEKYSKQEDFIKNVLWIQLMEMVVVFSITLHLKQPVFLLILMAMAALPPAMQTICMNCFNQCRRWGYESLDSL
eukprot:632063_1